ncbi:MAG: tRNA epoxyqueuosine(34) reductase QueG [Candidatus Eremiobacteraeota bacterium]|nr:tRNA epoxyqueuosine(34) reductase QueG [Candidatus Eremiobacteraeota bacterium]
MPRSDAGDLKALATRVALEVGAGAVRFARAFADRATRERMEASFGRGDLATWGFDRAYAGQAADPRAVLASAKTVICIAVPYATPSPPDDGQLRGRVSNYAWSPDYHHRVRAMLRTVAAALDDAVSENVTAIACDTAPLAERAFAAGAGLGWVGKHTNLISPELGSFIFLGEIVTSLDLVEDTPLRKSCGSCSLCVSACPTGALRGDYSIDATRCISDLTQRTDGIPRALRPLIGTWIWGCDLCQVACPPTQLARPTVAPVNAPYSSEAAAPTLVALLALKPEAFERTYRATAMGWRGAAVLRRNAAVALGNALDRSSVGALVHALGRDRHPMVRGHIAWALGRIGSPEAVDALLARSRREQNIKVREEIRTALEPYGGAAR